MLRFAAVALALLAAPCLAQSWGTEVDSVERPAWGSELWTQREASRCVMQCTATKPAVHEDADILRYAPM